MFYKNQHVFTILNTLARHFWNGFSHINIETHENDFVYDPFVGSGTIVKVSVLLNRKEVGTEISKEYVQIANRITEKY